MDESPVDGTNAATEARVIKLDMWGDVIVSWQSDVRTEEVDKAGEHFVDYRCHRALGDKEFVSSPPLGLVLG